MMSEEKMILHQINLIKDKSSKLYSYLYDLFYDGQVKNIALLERIYSSFLSDNQLSIKRIAIYGLLFGLQIKKQEYKNKAIEFIQDPESDFDLRLFSLSGLSQAYFDTADVELIRLFYALYTSQGEDSEIKATCFTGLLRLMGLNTAEITKENKKVIITESDIDTDKFASQILAIQRLINSK